MSQFSSRSTLVKRYPNVLKGLFIFGIGLFKKVVIADTFAISATPDSWSSAASIFRRIGNQPFLHLPALLRFQRLLRHGDWRLAVIQDLATDRLQLPVQIVRHPGFLRGARTSRSATSSATIFTFRSAATVLLAHRTYINLMLTFVLGGLWHGASWIFVIWGALPGGALVAHRLWQNSTSHSPHRSLGS